MVHNLTVKFQLGYGRLNLPHLGIHVLVCKVKISPTFSIGACSDRTVNDPLLPCSNIICFDSSNSLSFLVVVGNPSPKTEVVMGYCGPRPPPIFLKNLIIT